MTRMEPTNPATSAVPTMDAAPTSSPEQAPAVTTVEQLVHVAFDPSVRSGPTPQDLRSIIDDLSDATLEGERALVRGLARGDTFLQGPWRLLAALARSPLSATRHPVGRRVLGMAVEALVASPVFAGLAGRLDAPSDDKPLTALQVKTAANDVRAEDLGLEPRSLTTRDREKLRTAAVSCFLLYQVLRHDWTVEQVVDEAIDARLWRSDAKASPGSAAAALLSARGTANGLLTDYLAARRQEAEEAVREARASADQQARRAARAEQIEKDLRADVARAEETSAGLRTRVSELEAEVAIERRNRVADTSAHTDDYEQLRTRTLRNLTAQVELLSDGLAALREGVHDVADEYMERALGAIQKETDRLTELGRTER